MTNKQCKKIAKMFASFVVYHSAERIGWENGLTINEIAQIQEQIQKISFLINRNDTNFPGNLTDIIKFVKDKK